MISEYNIYREIKEMCVGVGCVVLFSAIAFVGFYWYVCRNIEQMGIMRENDMYYRCVYEDRLAPEECKFIMQRAK